MTGTSTTSDFFVGWAGGPAPRTRRHLWRTLAAAALLAAGVAVAAAALQRDTRAGVFEFGTTREFAGWIERHPHPVLVVPRPGTDEHSRYLLTAFGKRGADALFEAHGDAWVEFAGQLVHRDGRVMVEVAGDGVRTAEPPAGLVRPTAVPQELGRVTLVGEIVDSKCFLGVMKPGSAASHRACAIRCISGGVPPVLLVRDAEGLAHYHLLVAADGSAVNARVLPIVALPVEITGELQRLGDLSILRADPETYRLVE